jgi:hypothetical protein
MPWTSHSVQGGGEAGKRSLRYHDFPVNLAIESLDYHLNFFFELRELALQSNPILPGRLARHRRQPAPAPPAKNTGIYCCGAVKASQQI